MNLEGIILSGISQSLKDTHSDSTYLRSLEKSLMESESGMVIARGWGRREGAISVQQTQFQFRIMRTPRGG